MRWSLVVAVLVLFGLEARAGESSKTASPAHPSAKTPSAGGEAARQQQFLEEAARAKGAVTLPSGVIVQELVAGKGPSPRASDTVRVHYRGTLVNGVEFDSSYKRQTPAEFPLRAVIPCWTEGMQKLKVGGKARLVCPANTAYGERGAASVIPPNATLIFEVELLAIPS